jgi:nucleotide-binding universal stress UspA family protein
MGMHAKAKFRDLFVGTTIERVVRKGRLPVLIVKNKPTGGPYQTIVAGVDFAPGSRAALRTAEELSPKAVFEIVHAYTVPIIPTETSFIYLHTKEEMEDVAQKEMKIFLKDETAYFSKTHKGATTRLKSKIVEGFVLGELLKEVKVNKADVLAIGAANDANWNPGKIGGYAEEILANPPCDVLVARD